MPFGGLIQFNCEGKLLAESIEVAFDEISSGHQRGGWCLFFEFRATQLQS